MEAVRVKDRETFEGQLHMARKLTQNMDRETFHSVTRHRITSNYRLMLKARQDEEPQEEIDRREAIVEAWLYLSTEKFI